MYQKNIGEDTQLRKSNDDSITTNLSNIPSENICQFEKKKHDTDIYKAFITGEIEYGVLFKDLILNIDKCNFYLSSFANTVQSNKNTSKLVLYYKIFLRINNDIVNNFHSSSISEKAFICEIMDNRRIFYENVFKKYNIEDIYDIFSKVTLYFGYFKKELIAKKIIEYSHILGLDFKFLEIPELINDYWMIYYVINEESVSASTDSLDNLSSSLANNKRLFTQRIKHLEKCRITYGKISDISNQNDNKYFINYIANEDIRGYLKKNNLLTINNLKDLTEYEFKKIFYNTGYLALIENVILIFKDPIESIIYKHISFFFDRKLNDRQNKIFSMRANHYTLEEIGNSIGVTRERVRQIEKKVTKKYERYFNPEIINLLKSYNIFGLYIQRNQLKKILKDCLDRFIYMNKELYDKEMEILEFENLNPLKNYIEEVLVSRLDNYLHLDDLFQFANNINNDFIKSNNMDVREDYIVEYIKSKYYIEGEYLFVKKPSLLDKYEIIIKNHFADFPYLDKDNIEVFRDRYFEVFEDDKIYTKNSRSILARVSAHKNVVLAGRGAYKYTDEDNISLSKTLLDKIHTYIKKSKVALMEAVYIKFKDDIGNFIKNKYELHGILKRTFSDLYFSKDAVGLEPNPTINLSEIISNYAMSKNGVINSRDLIKDLPHLNGMLLEYQLSQVESLVGMYNHNYIHVDYLFLDKVEMDKVKQKVLEMLVDDRPVSSRILYRIMLTMARKTVKENSINNIHYAFNIFRYLYTDEFEYSLNYISLIGNSSNQSSLEKIKEDFIKKDIFKIASLNLEITKNQVYLQSKKDLLEYIYAHGFMRISEDLIAKTALVINERSNVIMNEVENKLIFYLNNSKKLSLNDLNFSVLPKISKPWNKHLLAHMLMATSKKIKVNTLGNQYIYLNYILTKVEDYND
jgi:transcriptional regulator with XRE-family HTH domain